MYLLVVLDHLCHLSLQLPLDHPAEKKINNFICARFSFKLLKVIIKVRRIFKVVPSFHPDLVDPEQRKMKKKLIKLKHNIY